MRGAIFTTKAVRHGAHGKGNGFSLVEVSVATGLAAFCLVALLGLMQSGLLQARASGDRIPAVHLLDAIKDVIRGEMRIPAHTSASAPAQNRFNVKIPAVGEALLAETFALDGKGAQTTLPGSSAYVVHYEIQAPDASQGAFKPYHVRILIAWPGAAAFEGSASGLLLKNSRGHLDLSLDLNRS